MNINFFKRKKVKIRLISFHTGTSGLNQHEEFINSLEENEVEIVHAYTLFHDHSHEHRPRSLNYVIRFKK